MKKKKESRLITMWTEKKAGISGEGKSGSISTTSITRTQHEMKKNEIKKKNRKGGGKVALWKGARQVYILEAALCIVAVHSYKRKSKRKERDSGTLRNKSEEYSRRAYRRKSIRERKREWEKRTRHRVRLVGGDKGHKLWRALCKCSFIYGRELCHVWGSARFMHGEGGGPHLYFDAASF